MTERRHLWMPQGARGKGLGIAAAMNGGRCSDMLDGEFCRDRGGRVGIIHDPGLLVGFKMDRLNPLGRHPLQKLAGRLDRGVAILAAGEYLVIAVRYSPGGT